MIKKFKTLFFVKSSLISLYLALTIPIPFISSDELKVLSLLLFVLGLIFILNITSDYVEISNSKISYKTNLLSKIFGKISWEILWTDIKLIKSSKTSQGSKVYYFTTKEEKKFLVPQRLENFENFKQIISEKTGLNVDYLSYISPLWTYKLLTLISVLMVIGELFAFSV